MMKKNYRRSIDEIFYVLMVTAFCLTSFGISLFLFRELPFLLAVCVCALVGLSALAPFFNVLVDWWLTRYRLQLLFDADLVETTLEPLEPAVAFEKEVKSNESDVLEVPLALPYQRTEMLYDPSTITSPFEPKSTAVIRVNKPIVNQ